MHFASLAKGEAVDPLGSGGRVSWTLSSGLSETRSCTALWTISEVAFKDIPVRRGWTSGKFWLVRVRDASEVPGVSTVDHTRHLLPSRHVLFVLILLHLTLCRTIFVQIV